MDFDSLVAGGEPVLVEAQLLDTQEGLQLDFKRAAGDKDGAIFKDNGTYGADGRRKIGRLISAFSNSAGGLVVIGVGRKKSAEGLDCAGDLHPFPGWKTAIGVLNGSIGELLQPKHDGIRVDGFPSLSDPDRGYVVVDVPQSDRRPHMCQANKHYYKRAGSSCFEMEHYDIEDAFKRFSEPFLEVIPERNLRSRLGNRLDYELRFWIRNVGRISAYQPTLEVRPLSNMQFQWDGEVEPHVDRKPFGQSMVSYGTSDFVVHPGQSRVIDKILFEVSYDANGTALSIGGMHPIQAKIQLQFFLHAKHMTTRALETSMTFIDLLQMGGSTG